MSGYNAKAPFFAIACGGTGGHLFPGLAVAEQLTERGCAVMLLISPKDVDQQAVKSARGVEIATLPAVALQNRNYFSFGRSFLRSWMASRDIFRLRPPHAVIAMGGFTSAPPVLAARQFGARTYLHESNTIPGRANRFLSRFVNEAFVGFPSAADRFRGRPVRHTGTPVRPQFHPRDPASCRAMFGLDPGRPTILVTGGSQGASGINDLVLSALPLLGDRVSSWQWLHLTGPKDVERVKAAYAGRGCKAVVRPFIAEMDQALGAATMAVSRAGASSLAELAATRLPALLVPYPSAADNHQFHNARAFESTGSARLLEQKGAKPEQVAAALCELMENQTSRTLLQTGLAQWHTPDAARRIAEIMLAETASHSSAAEGGAGNRTQPAHAALL